jgi:hypothetical protein
MSAGGFLRARWPVRRGAVVVACDLVRCAIVRVMAVPANRWP